MYPIIQGNKQTKISKVRKDLVMSFTSTDYDVELIFIVKICNLQEVAKGIKHVLPDQCVSQNRSRKKETLTV